MRKTTTCQLIHTVIINSIWATTCAYLGMPSWGIHSHYCLPNLAFSN